MYIFFEIATVIIECFFLHIYLHGLFQKYKRKGINILSSYFAFGVILCTLSLIPINPIIRLGAIAIAVIFLIMYSFDAKIMNAFYASLLLCIINLVVDNICSGIIVAFGAPSSSLFEYSDNRIVFIACAKIIQLFFFYLVIKLSNWHKSNESFISAIPLLLCQILSLFICYIMFLGVYKNHTTVTITFVIGAFGVLYINVIIFLYIERMKSIYEIRRQNELAEQQFKSEFEYFQQLKNDQEETRALWHDISKYMTTMKALIEADDIKHAKECVDQATEVFSNIGNVVDVGNTVISAILNQRVMKARRMGIEVTLDVRVLEELNVSSADLSIIIGNTFDNSLEACGLLPEGQKKISIHIIQREKILYYDIENPFTSIKTESKSLRKVQGYGLKNVRSCVEKYKGTMNIDKANDIFTVSIHLNL